MKPFNLEEALNGKPVCTKFGRSVKIISYEDEEEIEYPIRALIYVTKEDSTNIISETFTIDGKYNFWDSEDSPFDLMMV